MACWRCLASIAVHRILGANAILPHSRFIYDQESGLIKADGDPKLHLNVKGGAVKQGDPIILFPSGAQNHEMFDLGEDGHIRVGANDKLCINAEGGVSSGHRLITWDCDAAAENERFVVREDGRIHSQVNPDLCVNVKGGDMRDSAELILWTCSVGHDAPNEIFKYEDRMIKLVEKPELHFNLAGGETSKSAQVVLYSYRPGKHESFEFTALGQLRVREEQRQLRGSRGMCLNAEGGLQKGHPIVVWPCGDPPEPNELWEYDGDSKVILAKWNHELGFNIAGAAMEGGTAIVLWDLEDEEL